jgi:molybdate transport system substrate-binding protein
MISISCRLRAAMTAAAAIVASLFMPAVAANGAEIKVLSSVALTSALDELAPIFERTTGNKLVIDYGVAIQLRERFLAGEAADVMILTRQLMDDLQKQGKLTTGSLMNLGGTAVAVTVRTGAPKLDISSVDAFKRALLSVKSVVYADPTKGGASGVYFARVIDRLGLTEQLKAKTILVPGAQAAEVVARGDAELGIGQASEIVPVSGAQLLGPLPGDIASVTVFAAGISAGTKAPEADMAFIQFLTGPVAAPLLKAKGFEPR